MFQDFKELLSAFNAHAVRDLIVGGYAVCKTLRACRRVRNRLGDGDRAEVWVVTR
jgi:hypothetical protein